MARRCLLSPSRVLDQRRIRQRAAMPALERRLSVLGTDSVEDTLRHLIRFGSVASPDGHVSDSTDGGRQKPKRYVKTGQGSVSFTDRRSFPGHGNALQRWSPKSMSQAHRDQLHTAMHAVIRVLPARRGMTLFIAATDMMLCVHHPTARAAPKNGCGDDSDSDRGFRVSRGHDITY